jgi:hypothetical protein
MFKLHEEQDKEFEEIAMDPVRRRAMITHLTRYRTMILFMASLANVFALVFIYLRDDFTRHSGLLFGGAAMMWAFAFKYQSDLRILRVADRLQKDKDEKRPG